ncbi:MAG: lysophospholipase [Clostridiales Family XIII bacterium]|jgi:alpha-beta hydrolase superfamily lysophospholipase|nr:lysophospholipase [Clostridiales Family XIII bacterium]
MRENKNDKAANKDVLIQADEEYDANVPPAEGQTANIPPIEEHTATIQIRNGSGGENIRIFKWKANEPKALLQIAHGMAEHPARYDDFARFLTDHGISVYMNEHAGHGKEASTLGFFPGPDGISHVVDDMKSLTDEMKGEHSELPIFLLGHSMGSFLARIYITKYAEGLTGCILSSTAGPNPLEGVVLSIAKIQSKLKGPKSEAKFIDNLTGGMYLKRIKDPVNKRAWLSTVDDLCIKYDEDPYCGFVFTAQGYEGLLGMMVEINRKEWAGKVPTQLPVYLFAGSEDPVGDYGKGVIEVYRRLKDAGLTDLTAKLYPGGRHEMLNEANKEEVYDDTLAWLEAHV